MEQAISPVMSMRPGNRCRQAGVVMILTLIVLVLLLFSTMALVRSFDTSQSMAGNLAFRRDLTNQGERGMGKAMAKFRAGGDLVNKTTRQAHLLTSNYFATQLNSDDHGIPLMLIKDSDFTGTDSDIADPDTGVTIRYVIDRLCTLQGPANTPTPVAPDPNPYPNPNNDAYNYCVAFSRWGREGGTASGEPIKVGAGSKPVYRITVRASGPRNTQAFLQTTFAP